MDPDQILTKAKKRIGVLAQRVEDPTLAANDSDDDVLMLYLRTALRKAATRTSRIKGKCSVSVLQGQHSYTLPADVWEVRRVQLENDELHRVEGEQIQAHLESPDPDEGTPTHYGLVGTQILVYPVPQAQDVDKLLRVYYRSNGKFLEQGGTWTLSDPTAPMQEDTFFIQMPDELEQVLDDYVIGQWFIDSGEASRGVQLTQYFESQVEELATDPQKKRKAKRTYRLF